MHVTWNHWQSIKSYQRWILFNQSSVHEEYSESKAWEVREYQQDAEVTRLLQVTDKSSFSRKASIMLIGMGMESYVREEGQGGTEDGSPIIVTVCIGMNSYT